MDFSAESSFYKYNEQWGWFGWSDEFGGNSTKTMPLSVGEQENLKYRHYDGGSENPQLLTPYYNIGFNSAQPHSDALKCARADDKGYKLYGSYNAQNYLRRLSIHVKSLNYGQWEYDPSSEKEVHALSDIPEMDNVVGAVQQRYITNGGGGRAGTPLDGGTKELTLLDINTQDLYYKELKQCLTDWDDPKEQHWDKWPEVNRTYGFGQYGGQEVPPLPCGPTFKRYASPVKGAPARIRRIPIYQKVVSKSDSSANNCGDHLFADQTTGDTAMWSVDECGNLTISEKAKLEYGDEYSIDLNIHTLGKLIEAAGGSARCGDCPVSEGPTVTYKTGYYYTLSTAPVMAKGVTGTPSEMGLGWDPGPGVTSSWAPQSGYGIVVEDLTCGPSCLPVIRDVKTKGFDGDTTSEGAGACKDLYLDMGLYTAYPNTSSGMLYVTGSEGDHSPVLDVGPSNLWIGDGNTGESCTFFEKGLKSGDCAVITGAVLVDGEDIPCDSYWKHTNNIEDFIDIYRLAEADLQPSCVDSTGHKDEYYETEPSGPIEHIPEEGAIKINLRQLVGTGCTTVHKGEDLFPEDCEARNYLYISGACGSGSGSYITGTGCATTYKEDIDGQEYTVVSGHCPSGAYVTGTGCATTYKEDIGGQEYIVVSGHCATGVYVTGTGCATTYKEDIDGQEYTVVSGHCPSGAYVTGTGCATTYKEDIDGQEYIVVSGHCATGVYVTGTGCATTYKEDIDGQEYIVVSGDCTTDVYVTGTGCSTTYKEDIDGQEYIVVSGHCATGVYVTGTGCATTYKEDIGGQEYIVVSGDCTTDVYVTGTGCSTTYKEDIDGQEYIVVSGDCTTDVYVTGTGCATTYKEDIDGQKYIVVSGDCTTDVYVTGTGCATTYKEDIDGQEYIVVSGDCTTGNLSDIQNITGTGCVTSLRLGDTIYLNSSHSVSSNGSNLLSGIESTECGSNLVLKSLEGKPGSCIGVQDGPGNILYLTGGCGGSSSYQQITGEACVSTYEEGGVLYVSGHCSTGNLSDVENITGTGCASTYKIGDTLYISGQCSTGNLSDVQNITGTGCVTSLRLGDTIYLNSSHSVSSNGSNLLSGIESTECGSNLVLKTLEGKPGSCIGVQDGPGNILYLTGGCGGSSSYQQITGEACVSTYEEGGVLYVSGHCSTGNLSDVENITGTGCISTHKIGDTLYVSGEKGITGATSANLDNLANVYSGIVFGDCGDELVFRQLSGLNCINVTDFDDHIEVYADISWTANHGESNLWIGEHGITTPGGDIARTNNPENACDFVWNLKSITGVGCISSYIEDNTIAISGQDCFPAGGNSCDVLVGPSDDASWKSAEDLILDCMGLSWKQVTMCEDDGSTACYEILARQVSCTTTSTPTSTTSTPTSTTSTPTSTTSAPTSTTSAPTSTTSAPTSTTSAPTSTTSAPTSTTSAPTSTTTTLP